MMAKQNIREMINCALRDRVVSRITSEIHAVFLSRDGEQKDCNC